MRRMAGNGARWTLGADQGTTAPAPSTSPAWIVRQQQARHRCGSAATVASTHPLYADSGKGGCRCSNGRQWGAVRRQRLHSCSSLVGDPAASAASSCWPRLPPATAGTQRRMGTRASSTTGKGVETANGIQFETGKVGQITATARGPNRPQLRHRDGQTCSAVGRHYRRSVVAACSVSKLRAAGMQQMQRLRVAYFLQGV